MKLKSPPTLYHSSPCACGKSNEDLPCTASVLTTQDGSPLCEDCADSDGLVTCDYCGRLAECRVLEDRYLPEYVCDSRACEVRAGL